jgi:predicted nucleic acid-binding protein
LVFVLDNSVSMRWAFNDGSPADQHYADSVLALLESNPDVTAIVPSLWWLEAANTLVRAEKQNLIKQSDTNTFFELIKELSPVTELNSHYFLTDLIIPLAKAQNLSVYDATYLGICVAKGLALASLDTALIQAAKRTGVATLIVN